MIKPAAHEQGQRKGHGRARWSAPKVPSQLTRHCPKCGAQPHRSCTITRGGNLGPEGVYTVRMKGFHDERNDRPPRAEGRPAVATHAAPLTLHGTAGCQRRWRARSVKAHAVGGCSPDAALDLTKRVPAADVPAGERCQRRGCAGRWPA